MPDPNKEPRVPAIGEFRRYRQGLAALYLVIAGLGVTLLVASVIRGLFFASPAEAATDASRRDCVRDLTVAIDQAREQIPAHLADMLQQGDSETRANGRIPLNARAAARCARAANSPVDRAIREAADALADLDRGTRQTSKSFQQNVADPMARADTALTRARALLGLEGTPQ